MFAILVAAFIYIVTPGPVFLSIISLVAERGRREGLKLVSGAIFGCMLWLTFTSASLIESERLPAMLFLILSCACGFFLLWLGYRMFKSVQNTNIRVFEQPLRDGFILGVLNPKSYPVMLAVFSALIVNERHILTWNDFPVFFVTAVAGFVMGYLFMVFISGFSAIRKFYTDRISLFSKLFGTLYVGFGLKLLFAAFLV